MSSMNEILYTDRPSLEGNCTGNSTGLYVGDTNSAIESNTLELKTANVHGILNVALDNFDTSFPTPGYTLLFSKVGLCDTGPYPGSSVHNTAKTMIKAVQAIDQLFGAVSSENDPKILVHCWSGGSRSVTVAALWIAQRLRYTPTSGQTRLMTAINMVRKCRQLGYGNPYDSIQSYLPYNPSSPDASGTPENPYPDGKPMAAVYELAQQIDNTMTIPIGKGKPPSPNEAGECPKSSKS